MFLLSTSTKVLSFCFASILRNKNMGGKKQHINPGGHPKNPAFSQAVVTQGRGKTIYIGGQDAVDAEGNKVGKGDIAAQTGQAMKNIQTVLEACDATFNDLV